MSVVMVGDAPLVPVGLGAVLWLARGDRGVSSDTIFAYLTGVPTGFVTSHPRDPADFARCRRLLEAVPEFAPYFPRMREVSPVWARLVEVWKALSETMDTEAPGWRQGIGTCERTYRWMKNIGC